MRTGVKPSAVFLIHLVQDVSVLRPLIFMVARDIGFDTLVLVSTKFIARDISGLWQAELAQLSDESGSRLEYFRDDWEARRHLEGKGLLIAASESSLPQHATTHDVFRLAPSSYLKVTVQHGFECVGLRHSDAHVRAHGKTASFGADIVCSWFGFDQLNSLAHSQRGKICVTGPTSVLQMWPGEYDRPREPIGIVCENLHSVRFSGSEGSRNEFVDTFAQFSKGMAARKKKIMLRTHPGGQYVVKNRIALAPNVQIEQAPLYRLDLRQFSYAISAPSSVLIDLLLAQIPTAVWRPSRSRPDITGYQGLHMVSSPEDWIQFVRSAEANPQPFLDRQTEFLRKTGMPLDAREVFVRFAQLFRSAERSFMPAIRAGNREAPGAGDYRRPVQT